MGNKIIVAQKPVLIMDVAPVSGTVLFPGSSTALTYGSDFETVFRLEELWRQRTQAPPRFVVTTRRPSASSVSAQSDRERSPEKELYTIGVIAEITFPKMTTELTEREVTLSFLARAFGRVRINRFIGEGFPLKAEVVEMPDALPLSAGGQSDEFTRQFFREVGEFLKLAAECAQTSAHKDRAFALVRIISELIDAVRQGDTQAVETLIYGHRVSLHLGRSSGHLASFKVRRGFLPMLFSEGREDELVPHLQQILECTNALERLHLAAALIGDERKPRESAVAEPDDEGAEYGDQGGVPTPSFNEGSHQETALSVPDAVQDTREEKTDFTADTAKRIERWLQEILSKPDEPVVAGEAKYDHVTPLDGERISEFTENTVRFLRTRIVAQDRCVESLSRVPEAMRSSLRNPDTPIMALLLLGPSGVGKTHSVEALAELLFRNPSAYTRLDLSEYSEPHTVARLLGSPPGYIGFDQRLSGRSSTAGFSQWNIDKHAFYAENDTPEFKVTRRKLENAEKELKGVIGELDEVEEALQRLTTAQQNNVLLKKHVKITQRLHHKYTLLMRRYAELLELFEALKQGAGYIEYDPRHRRNSIVLWDELEKAHPAIWNLMLQIFTTGKTTLANGSVTDFSNSVHAVTSNIGSRRIQDILSKGTKVIGLHSFEKSRDEVDYSEREKKEIADKIYHVAMEELPTVVPNELVGRFSLGRNRIVVCHPLARNDVANIFDLRVRSYRRHLELMGFAVTFRITAEAKAFIVGESFDHKEWGARELDGKMQRYLWNIIENLESTGQIKPADELLFDVKPSEKSDEKPRIVVFRVEHGTAQELRVKKETSS